jgi:hypothetical protein
MSAISGEEDLNPPETGNEAQSVVTRAYLNKDTYFLQPPPPSATAHQMLQPRTMATEPENNGRFTERAGGT